MTSNLTPIFKGEVRDNKLVLDEPHKANQWLAQLNGKRVQMIVRKQKKIRSIKQNNFYWAVVVPIMAREWQVSPEQAHEALKAEFNPDISKKCPFKVGKTTTELSTTEFDIYIERIRIYASENGISIPMPDEADAQWISKNCL